MKWQVRFQEAVTLDFGESVSFLAWAWTDVKPMWMCDAGVKAMVAMVDQGKAFDLIDFSGTTYSSSNADQMKKVIGECYRQLIPFKTMA